MQGLHGCTQHDASISDIPVFIRDGPVRIPVRALTTLRFIVGGLPLTTNVDDVPKSGTRPIRSIFFTLFWSLPFSHMGGGDGVRIRHTEVMCVIMNHWITRTITI